MNPQRKQRFLHTEFYEAFFFTVKLIVYTSSEQQLDRVRGDWVCRNLCLELTKSENGHTYEVGNHSRNLNHWISQYNKPYTLKANVKGLSQRYQTVFTHAPNSQVIR